MPKPSVRGRCRTKRWVDIIGENFEATHQKVGTFQIVAGQKQGGNVASYFCLSDGTVVHAVAGPLDAHQFLREAKWAIEVRKLAMTEADGQSALSGYDPQGALERLASEQGLPLQAKLLPHLHRRPADSHRQHASPSRGPCCTQGQVHSCSRTTRCRSSHSFTQSFSRGF